MASYSFSVQLQSIYGTHGEFAVGVGPNKIKAKYLLTKVRPGNEGSWENLLASQMAPWREIFQIEELSFDELIQRDLDDSRVAHDMIPYLLGETGHHARFFPPVLAVLVPRKAQGTGIAARYPKPSSDSSVEAFGDLFNFDEVILNDQRSPLGVINYNAQRTAMVIVDGQHRAMAVLALHRQINKSWQSDPFAPYYTHIEVTSETVAHIELPVCIIYFPDIHEENIELKESGVDLITVCREIFTVVNKSAKPVGKSRELLLNDEDFAAFMMRRTLTKLKGQNDTDQTRARIYSFAFGDDEGSTSGQGLSGRLEYTSAVAIHKMHGAVGFAMPGAFALINTQDVTDGRYVRNSTRPADLLSGEIQTKNLKSISKRSAKTHPPTVTEAITEKIGDITDSIILPFFDELRPFAVHNQAMRELLEALNDPAARAEPTQSKCKSLIFDGSGTRSVFEEHTERLKKRKDDLSESCQPIPAHLEQQITYCEGVAKALEKHEDDLKLNRAFKLFNIDPIAFQNRDKGEVENDKKVLRTRARSIFDAVATQAFQIGYLMSVLTTVERITPAGTSYAQRAKNTNFIAKLYLCGLNTLFATGTTKHKTLTGYVYDKRSQAFDGSSEGFRGLLQAGNVRELNEKQWEFFRFMILEIVHSKKAFEKVKEVLNAPEWADQAIAYREALPNLLNDLKTVREAYFEAAFRAATSTDDFKRQCLQAEADAKANGKSEPEIKQEIEDMISIKRQNIKLVCKAHLEASLGQVESPEKVLKRFEAPDMKIGSDQTPTSKDVADLISESLTAEEVLHNAPSATGDFSSD